MVDTVVIVALPAEDDYVNKISSEKKPHLTLMYLGENLDMDRLPEVVQYIQHVAKTSMHRFGLSVDRRGTLGDKGADVLFFEDGWQTREIKEIQGYLRADPNISVAYDLSKKFPKWIPHLTLGYPETPANPDTRDYPGLHHVTFDRLALWVGDSEGPEFRLESYDYSVGELAMSDGLVEMGASFAEAFFDEDALEHYGKLGMKWGVRSTKSPTGVQLQAKPGSRVKAKGGANMDASEDAKRTATQKQVAKKSSTDALSNDELKQLVERMNLEASYERLAAQSRGNNIVRKMFSEPKYRNQQIEGLERLTKPAKRGAVAALTVAGVRKAIKKTDLSGIGN